MLKLHCLVGLRYVTYLHLRGTTHLLGRQRGHPIGQLQWRGGFRQRRERRSWMRSLIVKMKTYMLYCCGPACKMTHWISFVLFQLPLNNIASTVQSDPTCVGDGTLLPASISGEEGRGPCPRGDSRPIGSPGDKLSLLSSSHDELSTEAFGNCVPERGREGGWVEEERENSYLGK